jgi:hypothetical protein
MARAKIEEFAQQHPWCCFCGGANRTQTRDEVPPRSMFLNKEWPEGYQFPACKKCNEGSRLDDQLLALFARMSFLDKHAASDNIAPFAAGVRNNSPSAFPVTPDNSDLREIFGEHESRLPKGLPEGAVEIALVPADSFQRLDSVFQKLFCALYYKHLGEIIPNQSNLFRLATTNQILSDDRPYDWMGLPGATEYPNIFRGNRSLTDQFDYRWGFDPKDGLFKVVFQLRYSVFGVMVGPIPDRYVSEFEADAIITTGRSGD